MAAESSERIYLDHNATTPVLPEVVEAMRACWSEPYLNPASQHEFGRRARRVLEDARERIGAFFGITTTGGGSDYVVFTSGGTESNNLAVRGLIERIKGAKSPVRNAAEAASHIIVSAIEHPSIAMLANVLERRGVPVDRLGVDSHGVMRVNDLTALLRADTEIVAAMLANNETGVIQPVAEITAICGDRGILVHTDAAQAAGKLAINFLALETATMTIAAHKFGGPIGIGALLVRHEAPLAPQMVGGFHQNGFRAGTEPVALAVGMCRALELWDANRGEWSARLQHLRDTFESLLLSATFDTCRIEVIGADAPRLPNTSNIAFRGLDRQQLFIALDQAGVACSTGSACASGSSEASPVHIAMGLEPSVISSALRFSFGVQTTAEQAAEAARRIIQICNNLRREK